MINTTPSRFISFNGLSLNFPSTAPVTDTVFSINGTNVSYNLPSNKDTFTKVGHGFVVGDALYFDTGTVTWEKAIANSDVSLVVGFVSGVVDVDNFVIQYSGSFTKTAHGLEVGTYYYLDSVTAGSITDIEPSTYSNPCIYVLSASKLLIIPYRPSFKPSVVSVFEKTEGIDFNTVADTTLYTVPLGKEFIIESFIVEIDSVSGVSGSPVFKIKTKDSIDADIDITDSYLIESAQAGYCYKYTLEGKQFVSLATKNIVLSLTTGFSAGSSSVSVHLIGYLKDA